MDRELLSRLKNDKSRLKEFKQVSYDLIKPYENQLGTPKGYIFQRHIVNEAYLAFIKAQDIGQPYEFLSVWSDLIGIPEVALKGYLNLITINLELLRDSPNPMEELKKVMRHAKFS